MLGKRKRVVDSYSRGKSDKSHHGPQRLWCFMSLSCQPRRQVWLQIKSLDMLLKLHRHVWLHMIGLLRHSCWIPISQPWKPPLSGLTTQLRWPHFCLAQTGFWWPRNITTHLPNSLSTDVVPEPIPCTPLPPTPLSPTTPGPINELCNQIYMAASPYPASPEQMLAAPEVDVAALQQQLLQLIKVYPVMEAPLDLDATLSEDDVPLGQLFGLPDVWPRPKLRLRPDPGGCLRPTGACTTGLIIQLPSGRGSIGAAASKALMVPVMHLLEKGKLSEAGCK
eukprot:2480645-Amphidinium_carterae.1